MKNQLYILKRLGIDGVTTLLLSNLIILFSLGFTLGPILGRVYRTAKTTPFTVMPSSVVLVLGARLCEDRITSLFKQRLDRALELCQTHKSTQILILGGTTPGNRTSEAETGRRYLIKQGIKTGDILIEDQSINTLENFKHARSIIATIGETPVIISNRFHLARCATLAQGMGLKLDLCAAEKEFSLSFTIGIRLLLESYYLHWYEIGKRWSYWIGNKKSLERIS